MAKYVYSFGDGKAEGNKDMKNLLGGKGAGLAEMSSIGLPVPPGFTIGTDMCTVYYANKGQYPQELKDQVNEALKGVEKILGRNFGDSENPLLVSVRSGARQSMPGMMETVLNVGLTTKTIPGMIKKTNNERFVYDAYRRLIMMYSDVVMEKAAGIEPEEGKGIRLQLDHMMDEVKKAKGYKVDTDLTVDDLKKLCEDFKVRVKEVLGKPFPDEPIEQLWGAVGAVFQSWNGKRAISYRRIENIPDDWGTAVNVQSMVFGNMGDTSGTGVGFTRNPATGENMFFGEWLSNAQGEDVVAGIRTPYAINEACKSDSNKMYNSMEQAFPEVYKQLNEIRLKLEKHYKDMQDIEFTVENGKLWMLQTRTGKRTGPAALRMAVEMVKEGLIEKKTALIRVTPNQLDELLHPMVDPIAARSYQSIAKGLPAGPGGATGKIVLTSEKAKLTGKQEKVILVRNETSPEDVDGMHASQAILTAKGGMTSHAALVARGWGKCCIVGCNALDIDVKAGTVRVGDLVLKEGDILTLNGTEGKVYVGSIPLVIIDPEKNEYLQSFLGWADEVSRLKVRTNADTPKDTEQAVRFGAKGIGLTRTEHMFFGENRILAMRKMIMAISKEEREKAVYELLPYQKEDFKGIFKALKGYPATIRTLDPPLHEFVPQDLEKFAKDTGKTLADVKARVEQLHELNPMLGHRGCRLGIVYPELTKMQAQAILEAAAEVMKEGTPVNVEIMIPIVGHVKEFIHQKKLVLQIGEEVKKKYGLTEFPYLIGTMIEVPRAALTADEIAKEAEFFSFGTNDLTQMGAGFSRDDVAGFLPKYVEMGIYAADPFQSLDQAGIGQLLQIAVTKGRATRPNLKIGICGEHGGDPDSIDFCHRVGLDYVSCSPFRVPIARLAAAQAQLRSEKK